MLKTLYTTSALAVALIAAPAFAQTNPSPTPAPTQPGVQQPAQGTMQNQPGTAGSAGVQNMQSTQGNARFFTAMEMDQWRASKFVGVDIYGANNEKIGDVDDIILDQQGKVEAVVIGVGGFLGIGEKQVALPFDQVEWMTDQRSTAVSTNAPRTGTTAAPAGTTASNAPAATAPAGSGVNQPATGANAPATTANAPAGTASAPAARNPDITASTTRAGARQDYPTYGFLRMTRQDLENAPSYKYGEQAR